AFSCRNKHDWTAVRHARLDLTNISAGRRGTMALRRIVLACGWGIAATLAFPASSFAQSHPEFVPLGRVSAALYKPNSGPAPHVAFLVSHRTGNNLNNSACKELAKRGFLALCWNTRFVNNEAAVHWED